MRRLSPWVLTGCAVASTMTLGCERAAPPAAVAPIGAVAAPAAEAEPAPAPDAAAPERLGEIASDDIDESSGLAASLRHPGTWWTCNDSGNKPRLYRFDATGAVVQALDIAGATHRDWESLASFEVEGRPMLLIADVGDNTRKRLDTALHLLPEPTVEVDRAEVAVSIRVRFADGPRDCEAVAVDASDPAGPVAWLISKEVDQRANMYGDSGLYRLELAPYLNGDALDRAPALLPRLTDLPMTMPTGFSIDAGGRRAAISTYGDGWWVERAPGEAWADALTGDLRVLPLPPRRQGEAVALEPGGGAAVLTSEGRRQPVWRVPLR